ncbi:MAG: low-complexity protein [Betaproteobacteria bacterium]|nr:low-complexity protein [Betaproteobacteria bacterium]
MARRKTALTLAVGSAFAASLATPALAQPGSNPFAMQSLKTGYQVADVMDGNGNPVPGVNKAKEAKCGSDKAQEAQNDSDKKKEGKCGEGKCGGSK